MGFHLAYIITKLLLHRLNKCEVPAIVKHGHSNDAFGNWGNNNAGGGVCVCVCGHRESTETWVDLRQDTNCFLVLVSVSSVQFSRSVVSDSLGPHESQHARPPCPSLTPGVHSNSSPLSPHTSFLMGVHGGALVL